MGKTKQNKKQEEIKEEIVEFDGFDIDQAEEQKGLEIWKPIKEGAKLVGRIVEIKDGKYGKDYTLRRMASEEQVRLPAHKVLLDRLAKVELGDTVAILFDGYLPATKEGNNDTPLYRVWITK